MVVSRKPSTIFAKSSLVDFPLGCEYISVIRKIQKKINIKHLQVVYFQFKSYGASTNSSNKKTAFAAFLRPFQRVSYVYQTNLL